MKNCIKISRPGRFWRAVTSWTFSSPYYLTYIFCSSRHVHFRTSKHIVFRESNTFQARKTTLSNYKPISLLSSFSKLLEKVAVIQIMKYLNKFKLLYEHQYCLRAKHNTTQPLIHFLDKIYNALNKPVSEYT